MGADAQTKDAEVRTTVGSSVLPGERYTLKNNVKDAFSRRIYTYRKMFSAKRRGNFAGYT